MGQKVNPHGLRVGVINGWNTQWYADKKEFSKYLKEDNMIRTFLKKKYYAAAISKILIERAASRIVVTIYTARPGVIIGKAGSEVETIKKDLARLTNGKSISINITEVRKPDCDAQLVAESVAAQLEKRMSFRRCMKQAIGRSMRAGVKGIKMMVRDVLTARKSPDASSITKGLFLFKRSARISITDLRKRTPRSV